MDLNPSSESTGSVVGMGGQALLRTPATVITTFSDMLSYIVCPRSGKLPGQGLALGGRGL